MKLIGLIGGMSWESTALYYRIINHEIKLTMGKLHSAQLLLYSFDFEEIVKLQKTQAWPKAAEKLTEAGNALKSAGVQALVICTNTMHIVAKEVEDGTGLPVLHIADCTGEEITQRGLRTIGLLGTQITMEHAFYKNRLEENFGIKVIVPEMEDRLFVHNVIYNELCQGIVNPASKKRYQEIIFQLKLQGAQGIILGCTEICMLMDDKESDGLPLFDTTLIHARYAARIMMHPSKIDML